MQNIIQPLAKGVLIPLGLTAAAKAVDSGINKKILGYGTTKPIISTDKLEDMMKIVKSFEDSSLLLKLVSKTIQN